MMAALWFHGTSLEGRAFFFNPQPAGYYGLQTAGFAAGHLYAAVQPSPGLLALKDPYDPTANAPFRIHDMTLWRGRYYLYYGVTPVLVFFMPWLALTGWYPEEAWAVAFFCSVGVAAALGLLGAVRWRFFPTAPRWALVMGALVLVLASPVARLTQAVSFYQVPITAAFALHMMTLVAIYAALTAGRKARWIWLTAASTLYGLSIGSRPNYVLSGFALVVPWAVLVWRDRRRGGWWPGLRLGLAAFGPALLAGFGLLFYNWARFGAATEFGIKYTLGGERIPDIKLMGLEYLWPHLGDYLTKAGNWSRYFPFFFSGGVPVGALRYGPWLALIPAALLFAGRGRHHGRAAFMWAAGMMATANLVMLSLFFGLTERYPPDYLPAALLLASCGGLVLSERIGAWRASAWVGAGLAAATIFFAQAIWIRGFYNQKLVLPVARLANLPTHWWERWRDETPGGLSVEFELPVGRIGLSEPLVHMGVSSDARDWLQIDYLPGDRARLGFFHAGLGLFSGREFAIPADRKLRVDFECGALLPPFAHPMFADWTEEEWTATSRRLRARVNGEEVLAGVIGCYETTSIQVQVGRMKWAGGSVRSEFTGRIGRVVHIPARKPVRQIDFRPAHRPIKLTLWMPADRVDGRDPLVFTGGGDRFDLLYCRYAGAGRVVFGLYHHGYEPVESQPLAFSPLTPQTLTVWMGSLADPAEQTRKEGDIPSAQRLTVVFNGAVALDQEQLFYPADLGTVKLGSNLPRGDFTGGSFSGAIEAVQSTSFTALPATEQVRRNGAVDMTVLFPQIPGRAAEPLVVTGVEGLGNFIYVRYLEGGKLVFGFDHWGVGGLVGEPVTVDLKQSHRLRITMGSLYPADAEVGAWRTRVEVKLDDAVVLEGTYACHPSTRVQVRIGENPIGGSTCGPSFSGRILQVERPVLPDS